MKQSREALRRSITYFLQAKEVTLHSRLLAASIGVIQLHTVRTWRGSALTKKVPQRIQVNLFGFVSYNVQ